MADIDHAYTCADIYALKGISIGSLNIRSLFRNLDEVQILLERTELNVLCLQETFLNSHVQSPIFSCNGYTLWRADRTAASGKQSGGGLCTYTNKKHTFTCLDNLTTCTPDIESQWVVMHLKDTRWTVIGNVYHPPQMAVLITP